jgi:hypothetical protein
MSHDIVDTPTPSSVMSHFEVAAGLTTETGFTRRVRDPLDGEAIGLLYESEWVLRNGCSGLRSNSSTNSGTSFRSVFTPGTRTLSRNCSSVRGLGDQIVRPALRMAAPGIDGLVEASPDALRHGEPERSDRRG